MSVPVVFFVIAAVGSGASERLVQRELLPWCITSSTLLNLLESRSAERWRKIAAAVYPPSPFGVLGTSWCLIIVRYHMSSTSPLNRSWSISAFAVFGAFTLCGFGGAIIAEMLSVWPLPAMGFCAAFAVVALTYLSAPKYKNQATTLIFIAGSLLAWLILKDIYLPNPNELLVPQHSYLPFISTVTGGAIALVICLAPALRGSGT